MMWGGGSGKSVAEAQREIIKSFSKGERCLCVRKVKDTCRDSVYGQLLEVINMWGLSPHFDCTTSPLSIRNKLTWSDFIFRGMDDPEKVKSVVGVSRVWIEEATEFDEKDFNQLDLRLRWLKDLQITLTYNPIDKDHWLNCNFWEKWENDNVTLLHTTYKDNKWAGDEYDKVMQRLKEQDENMYNIYALWLWWNKVEGLVFAFKELPNVPDGAELKWYGQDFGFTNDPSACIGLYKWNDGIILDEVFYKRWLTNSNIAGEYKTASIASTDLIVADSSEPKSIEEIYQYGYNIQPAVKWPDSIMFGIQVMKQYTIYLTARSQNLKKEFLNYCWAKDKNGKVLNKPIDSFNHGIDAARYIVSRVFGEKESLPQVYFFN